MFHVVHGCRVQFVLNQLVWTIMCISQKRLTLEFHLPPHCHIAVCRLSVICCFVLGVEYAFDLYHSNSYVYLFSCRLPIFYERILFTFDYALISYCVISWYNYIEQAEFSGSWICISTFCIIKPSFQIHDFDLTMTHDLAIDAWKKKIMQLQQITSETKWM